MPQSPQQFLLILSGTLGLAALTCDCQAPAKSYQSGNNRQTVAHDPRRHTATAQRDNEQAIRLLTDGHWTNAEAVLKQALTADPTYGPAHNTLGIVYEHIGDHYLAAWEYQYAATLMPQTPEPRNNLGLLYEEIGRLDDAIQWYDKAVSLQPQNSQYTGNDARARLKRGDHDKRVRDLLQNIIMSDDRPNWLRWARERLAMLPPPQH